MDADRLASALADSLARHQSRGLVDEAAGMTDVVIHGRVDLLGVAEDLLASALKEARPARRSWAGWFVRRADTRQAVRRRARDREKLCDQLESGANPAQSAIVRLRIRELDR